MGILDKRLREQTNDLIKIQTRDYIDFIKNVTEESNIMSKTFFVVVPFVPPLFQENKGGGFLSRIFPSGGKGSTQAAKQTLERFEENRSQLEQRKSIVVQGLGRVGIRTVALGTEELVELFYKIFNPGDQNVPVIQT